MRLLCNSLISRMNQATASNCSRGVKGYNGYCYLPVQTVRSNFSRPPAWLALINHPQISSSFSSPSAMERKNGKKKIDQSAFCWFQGVLILRWKLLNFDWFCQSKIAVRLPNCDDDRRPSGCNKLSSLQSSGMRIRLEAKDVSMLEKW